MENKCKNCMYCEKSSSSFLCKRHSPIIVEKDHETLFPEIAEDDWCGDFEDSNNDGWRYFLIAGVAHTEIGCFLHFNYVSEGDNDYFPNHIDIEKHVKQQLNNSIRTISSINILNIIEMSKKDYDQYIFVSENEV